MASFTRYVALGDSFSEGVGDVDDSRPNGVRGWADRVAEVLAEGSGGFTYANLAIRGRKIHRIVDEQIEPAVAMRPDLVTLNGGGNDILRPTVDIDAVAAALAGAVERLSEAGAHVVLFTGLDLAGAGMYGALRGRVATLNELVREIADEYDTSVVDVWRLRELRDGRYWDEDRLHLGPAGHHRMARAVLDALEVGHSLEPESLPERVHRSRQEHVAANLVWARSHAAPWVRRRLTGRSSGDDLSPRRPEPAPLGP